MAHMGDLILTVAEAAERLRCTRNHVYQLIEQNRLEATNIAVTEQRPRWRITESALRGFIDSNGD